MLDKLVPVVTEDFKDEVACEAHTSFVSFKAAEKTKTKKHTHTLAYRFVSIFCCHFISSYMYMYMYVFAINERLSYVPYLTDSSPFLLINPFSSHAQVNPPLTLVKPNTCMSNILEYYSNPVKSTETRQR